jgi:hypothetical protein
LPLIAIAITVSQSHNGPAANLAYGGVSGLPYRTVTVPGEFLAGFEARPLQLYAVLSGLLVLLAFALLVRRASPFERRGALVAGSIGVITVALPIAAVVLGHDYFSERNVIIAILPLWIVIGAGLGAATEGTAGTAGRLAALGLCGVAFTAIATTAWTPKYHYQDWRNVAAAMGRSTAARAVVVAPDFGTQALAVYLPGGLHGVGRSGATVSEVDVVATIRLTNGQDTDPPPPSPGAAPVVPAAGFRLAKIDHWRRFTLVRFVSSRPLRVTDAIARAAAFVGHPAAVLVQPAPH